MNMQLHLIDFSHRLVNARGPKIVGYILRFKFRCFIPTSLASCPSNGTGKGLPVLVWLWSVNLKMRYSNLKNNLRNLKI